MSDIYGPITEHPEYPITDSRRFTVTIRPHDFETPRARRDAAGRLYVDPYCARCGYSRVAAVHPKEEPTAATTTR